MAISATDYGSITSGTSSSASSLLQSSKNKKIAVYSDDVVNISQEAQELIEELRAKRNRNYVTNEQEASFARVANALPSSEIFSDMLDWLAAWAKADKTNFAVTDVEPDRNAYLKNPQKYADLWKGLYENYTTTMEKLGLNPSYSAHRTVLSDSRVLYKVRSAFTTNMNSDTKNLLSFFNISSV